MTITVQPSSPLITALQEAATLASLKATAFMPHRVDKEASIESDRVQGAAKGTGRLSVNRLSGVDDLHRKATLVQAEARRQFYDLTGAWHTDGFRLLPNQNMMAVAKLVRKGADQLLEIKAEMERDLPQLLLVAQQNLGHHADRLQLPTAREIIDSYSLTAEYQPIPDGSGFRGLPTETQKVMERMLHSRVAAGYVSALRDAINRLRDLLLDPDDGLAAKIARYEERLRLKDAGQDAGRTGIFRDTAVTNIRDMMAALKPLNITNDPTVADLMDKVADIAQFDPESLRNSPAVRVAVKDKLSQISDLLGPLTA